MLYEEFENLIDKRAKLAYPSYTRIVSSYEDGRRSLVDFLDIREFVFLDYVVERLGGWQNHYSCFLIKTSNGVEGWIIFPFSTNTNQFIILEPERGVEETVDNEPSVLVE